MSIPAEKKQRPLVSAIGAIKYDWHWPVFQVRQQSLRWGHCGTSNVLPFCRWIASPDLEKPFAYL